MSVPPTDAIILAGGNGSRLKGIAATGMKPLLVVNGEALISRLVRQVRPYVGGNTIVVTSPTNTAAICDLLETYPRLQYVVQPEPKGPGEALLRGIEAARTDRLLVLMADNWMSDDDVHAVATCDAEMVVGTEVMAAPNDVTRFTRVRRTHYRMQSEEGPELGWDTTNGPHLVWCGPLVLPKKKTWEMLWGVPDLGDELKLGCHLGDIADKDNYEFVRVTAQDIGIPEAL